MNEALLKRIAKVEELFSDHYWRAEIFGRDIVEREIGHALPKRHFKYRVTLPDGWTSEFDSEVNVRQLPHRINSVSLPVDAEISLV